LFAVYANLGHSLTMPKLPPFEERILQWHRRQVDRALDEASKVDRGPLTMNQVYYAKQKCTEYVEELRALGHDI